MIIKNKRGLMINRRILNILVSSGLFINRDILFSDIFDPPYISQSQGQKCSARTCVLEYSYGTQPALKGYEYPNPTESVSGIGLSPEAIADAYKAVISTPPLLPLFASSSEFMPEKTNLKDAFGASIP